MIELLSVPQNQAFTIALVVMLVIAMIEGVAVLFGAGLSHFLETLIPELHVDVDIDLDTAHASPTGAFTRFLSWLRVGTVPVLMLIVVFLTVFGLLGLTLQSILVRTTGLYLPGWVAVVPVVVVTLPIVRVVGGVLGLILPKDETDAVDERDFIGRIAIITLGTAGMGSPAQAKLTDQHGQAHYIMLEPDKDAERFEQGAAVLVTERHGAVFRGIRNSKDALVD